MISPNKLFKRERKKEKRSIYTYLMKEEKCLVPFFDFDQGRTIACAIRPNLPLTPLSHIPILLQDKQTTTLTTSIFFMISFHIAFLPPNLDLISLQLSARIHHYSHHNSHNGQFTTPCCFYHSLSTNVTNANESTPWFTCENEVSILMLSFNQATHLHLKNIGFTTAPINDPHLIVFN